MSVGHTARVLEEAGISTVCLYIRAFRHQADLLKVPRALITPHILGRTVGGVGQVQRQRKVVLSALYLLEAASGPGAVAEFDEYQT